MLTQGAGAGAPGPVQGLAGAAGQVLGAHFAGTWAVQAAPQVGGEAAEGAQAPPEQVKPAGHGPNPPPHEHWPVARMHVLVAPTIV